HRGMKPHRATLHRGTSHLAASDGEAHAATRHRQQTVRYSSGLASNALGENGASLLSQFPVSVRDRGGALLLDARREACEGARDDRLIRKVAKAIAIYIALVKAGHRPHAAIRPKAGQRTGENRFVGNVHYAVAGDVAALAGVADPI